MKLKYYEAENIRIAYSMSSDKDKIKENSILKYEIDEKIFNKIISRELYNKKPKDKPYISSIKRLNSYDARRIRELYEYYLNDDLVEKKSLSNFNDEVILNDFGTNLPIRRLRDIINKRSFKS